MKYKTIINFLLFFTFVCGISSCKGKKENKEILSLKNVVNNTIGKKLILPDSLEIYTPFTNYVSDSSEVFNSRYKVFSRIDASCGTCIGSVSSWSKLRSEFQRYNVPVVLIFHSDDRFELLKYYCESGQIENFPFPFFLDKKNIFVEINKFMEENKSFETVLTDADNTILLIGNPIYSEEVKKMYINEIKNYTDHTNFTNNE